MKTYLVKYWKPNKNPQLEPMGFYYPTFYKEDYQEIIKTNNIKGEVERIKEEIENFKTSIFPNFKWEFKLVDVKLL